MPRKSKAQLEAENVENILAVADAETTSEEPTDTPTSGEVPRLQSAEELISSVPNVNVEVQATIWPSIRRLIEHDIAQAPRSQQKRIGPSELGTDCVHCLAAKLAGWEQTVRDVAWLPFIGTCVHEHFERIFPNYCNPEDPDFWTEHKVTVGSLRGITGGYDVTGSIDLVDVSHQATIDWKIVGSTTLKNVKANGPSQQYLVQASLYGIGLQNEGVHVEKSCIYFLPRNAVSLNEVFPFETVFNPQLGGWALNRAQFLVTLLDAIESQEGLAVRDAWISKLPRSTTHCFDCEKFADSPLNSEFVESQAEVPDRWLNIIPTIQPTVPEKILHPTY